MELSGIIIYVTKHGQKENFNFSLLAANGTKMVVQLFVCLLHVRMFREFNTVGIIYLELLI